MSADIVERLGAPCLPSCFLTLTAGSLFNFKYHDSNALIDITNNPISGGYGFTLTDEKGIGGSAGSPVLQLSVGGNTYAGNTTIASGTLRMNAIDALPHGAGKGNVVLNGAASGVVSTLDLNGFSTTVNGLAGTSNTLLGMVTNSSATAATLTVGDGGTNSTFAGLIAGPLALTKIGAGTLTLSGANP
jgi:autotransporter-associated beta strand protein